MALTLKKICYHWMIMYNIHQKRQKCNAKSHKALNSIIIIHLHLITKDMKYTEPYHLAF